MPRSPFRPEPLRGQIFRGSEATSGGWLTARQLRSSAWLHLRYDVYADSRLTRDHYLTCVAALLNLPKEAIIAGPSAAYLYGVEHAARFDDDVHVIFPIPTEPVKQDGIRCHVTELGEQEVRDMRGIRCTSPLRTAWDIASWLSFADAVAVLDVLLRQGLVNREALLSLAEQRRGDRGSLLARNAFGIADGRAESPQESRLRAHAVAAGLPRPELQFPVVAGGRLLHPDLAWPEFKVALEYDGQWHDGRDQFHLDRQRLNLLVAEGWIVLHVTSRRMRTDLQGVLSELRRTLRSRGWRG